MTSWSSVRWSSAPGESLGTAFVRVSKPASLYRAPVRQAFVIFILQPDHCDCRYDGNEVMHCVGRSPTNMDSRHLLAQNYSIQPDLEATYRV